MKEDRPVVKSARMAGSEAGGTSRLGGTFARLLGILGLASAVPLSGCDAGRVGGALRARFQPVGLVSCTFLFDAQHVRWSPRCSGAS